MAMMAMVDSVGWGEQERRGGGPGKSASAILAGRRSFNLIAAVWDRATIQPVRHRQKRLSFRSRRIAASPGPLCGYLGSKPNKACSSTAASGPIPDIGHAEQFLG